MKPARDPYATPPAPREWGGPILRFAIVLALLGAAGWAYLTFSEGPGLTRSVEQAQRLAQANTRAAPTLPPTSMPETAPPPESAAPTPSTAQPQSAPPASSAPPG